MEEQREEITTEQAPMVEGNGAVEPVTVWIDPELRHEAFQKVVEREVALAASGAEVGPIVATVEGQMETELLRRLEAAESRIADLEARALSAAAEAVPARRKTLAVGTTSLLAKHGLQAEAGTSGVLDGALASLSVEQRILIKSEMLRAGLL